MNLPVHLLFQNQQPQCELRQSCALTSFQVDTEDYQTPFANGVALGTRLTASYTTHRVSQLRNFGVVQFIRGCVFQSQLNEDGTSVTKTIITSRDHLGSSIRFRHPTWTFDTINHDPMYWSFPEDSADRHFYYLWNRDRNSLNEHSVVLLGQQSPRFPKLHVTDLPSAASMYSPNTAMNVSLQFKTCLHRVEDIPRSVSVEDDPQPLMDTALHCFDWSSSLVYDFRTRRFESPQEIDAFCLE